MGCGCKGDTKKSSEGNKINEATFGGSLFIRIIMFLFSVAIIGVLMVPIIIPMIFLMLFNRIVRKKDTNVMGGLLKIGKMLRTSKKRDEEDESDYEDVNGDDKNPDDYELMDVDVIN